MKIAQADNGTKIKTDDKGSQRFLIQSWNDEKMRNNFYYFFSSWYKFILHLEVELQEPNIILQDVIRIICLQQYKRILISFAEVNNFWFRKRRQTFSAIFYLFCVLLRNDVLK